MYNQCVVNFADPESHGNFAMHYKANPALFGKFADLDLRTEADQIESGMPLFTIKQTAGF